MTRITLLTCFFLSLWLRLDGQSAFSETYFSANHPKPTGEILDIVKSPDMAFLRASSPYGDNLYRKECIYAINSDGQPVWNSFDWDDLPEENLQILQMVLGSGNALYVLLRGSDPNNTSVAIFFLLKVNSLSGIPVWRKKYSGGAKPYRIVERTAAEVMVFSYDSNFKTLFEKISAQDGTSLKNDKLVSTVGGISQMMVDGSGDLIYTMVDSIWKVDGADPKIVRWRSRILNACNAPYSEPRFVIQPGGQSMLFFSFVNNSSGDCYTRALVNLNTGAVMPVNSYYSSHSLLISDQVTIGDTAFFCVYDLASSSFALSLRFSLVAYRISDGSDVYQKAYTITEASPAQKYSNAFSMDLGPDGNLYLAGFSCIGNYPGGAFSLLKVRPSDGEMLWNNVIDLTNGDVDDASYARFMWCPSNGKLLTGGTIQLRPGLRCPTVFEIDGANGMAVKENRLGGDYDFPSAVTRFLPLADGFCALKQLDNCISVARYTWAQQPVWEHEICQPQLLKAGGIYEGKDNTLFVSGANFTTGGSSMSIESPLKVDSTHFYRLDLNTGAEQGHWKISTPTGGYPVHVAAQSDTIVFFAQDNGSRRTHRLINGQLVTNSVYQSSVAEPMPLAPPGTYLQRGRETVAVLSTTQYLVNFPESRNSYNYPSTAVLVKGAALLANSRDIIAGGTKNTNTGWSLIRFKAGANTTLWQASGDAGRINRVLIVNNQDVYTCGTLSKSLYLKKFDASTGAVLWERNLNMPDVFTVNDMAYDTVTKKLLLCGSSTGQGNQKFVWLSLMASDGSYWQQTRRDGDTSGPSNQALCAQALPSGQFLLGGQLQRSGLDTAGFIWKLSGQLYGVGGQVYCDANNNAQKDSDEIPWTQTVAITPGNYVSFPRADGFYETHLFSDGMYEAGILSPSPHYEVKNVKFTAGGTFVTGADIRLVPKYSIFDAGVSLAEIDPVRYGFETNLLIGVQNLGTAKADSFLLELDCGPSFALTGLEPVGNPSALRSFRLLPNGTLEATLSGATALQEEFFTAQGKLTAFLPIGDTLHCTAKLTPFPLNDAVPDNNLASVALIVTGSFDPNDVTAYPQNRVVTTSLAPDGSLDLTYRIRFENTGNATTDFLRVENDYSPLLRPETFRLGATSAPCTVRFLDGYRLEFSFDAYHLPPAQADSMGAQGYIFYRIKSVPGLAAGDTLANKAAIYFDFNPPVHTNRALTWVEKPVVGTVEPAAKPAFALSPNPAKAGTVLHFSGPLPLEETWRMFDPNGRLLEAGTVANGVPARQPGLYQVLCRGQVLKLVVIR